MEDLGTDLPGSLALFVRIRYEQQSCATHTELVPWPGLLTCPCTDLQVLYKQLGGV